VFVEVKARNNLDEAAESVTSPAAKNCCGGGSLACHLSGRQREGYSFRRDVGRARQDA
jgi:Holliday junction resolvase-like predicted endonuclease